AQDFLALGLGDAAGDHDPHGTPIGFGCPLPFAHAAELRINLFGCLLANVASVEDHELRGLRGGRLDEAMSGPQIRHTMRIVGVHLAAVGFDVELAGFAHAAWVDADPGRSGARCISRSSGASVIPFLAVAPLLAIFSAKRNARYGSDHGNAAV